MEARVSAVAWLTDEGPGEVGNRLLRRIGLRNYLLRGVQSDAVRIGRGAAINLQALVMRNIFSLHRRRDNQEGQQVSLHRDEAETNSASLYRFPRHEAPNKVTFRAEDLEQRLSLQQLLL